MAPLTIAQWRLAQQDDKALTRLLSLIKTETELNETTHTWICLATETQIKQQWQNVQQAAESEKTNKRAKLPLLGVPFAVKDNIDVQGFVTTAGCPSFSSQAAAKDAPVIGRLKAAGAIVLGKTNMDQFATGMMGTRSPYGLVPNAVDKSRVSGGSSAGSAVVVSRGAVPFSLGSDTAGSCRVPAGLNNIIGVKPTNGSLSARGVVPACRTLDCVSIFALNLDDAELLLNLTESFDVEDAYSKSRPEQCPAPPPPLAPGFGLRAMLPVQPTIAVCAEMEWFGRQDHAPAYKDALKKADKLNWKVSPVNFDNLFTLGDLLYGGPWVSERYAAIKEFFDSRSSSSNSSDMDSAVERILEDSKKFSASDAFAFEYQRQTLVRKIQVQFKDFDAILVPTTPTFPTLEQAKENPTLENTQLGRYSSFVNFLGWSAITIPAGTRPDGLPFSITLISSAWQEAKLLELGRQWIDGEPRRLGATGAFTRWFRKLTL